MRGAADSSSSDHKGASITQRRPSCIIILAIRVCATFYALTGKESPSSRFSTLPDPALALESKTIPGTFFEADVSGGPERF